MGRILSLATLAAMAFSARSAAAAPSARLVYGRAPGAETCGDESALRAAVASRVGYDPFFPWAPLTVTVEVTAEGGRPRGRVAFVSGDGLVKGTQTIDAPARGAAAATCDDLLASIALSIAVALDATETSPEGVAEPPATETAQPAPPPLPPAPAPPPPASTTDAAPHAAGAGGSSPRFSAWVAPGARASLGGWNGAAVGPSLLVELRRGALGFGVEGRYDVATVGVGDGSQATVQRATGSALPCLHAGWFVGCGLAAFGETWARGNVAQPTTESAPYVALGARAGVDVPLLPKLHVLASADVAGVVTRTVLTLDSGNTGSVGNGPVEASGGVALLVPIL